MDAVNSPLMVRRSVAGSCFDRASRLFDPGDHLSDDVRVHAPKRPIDLDVAIVAIRA